jgi:hypothetical protein
MQANVTHKIRRQIPFFILVLLPAFLMGMLVFKYGVNFPFSDQWQLASMFEKIYAGNLSFNDLFAQFHESRKFFPRLIFIGLAYLTNWDVRAEMWVIFLLTCLVSVNIYWLSCLTIKASLKNRLLIFAVANLLIFSPAQYENWLWGIQVVVYLPIACITAGLVLANSQLNEKSKLLIGLFLCIISTFSYANGMLSWLLVFPALIVGNCYNWREVFEQKLLIFGGAIAFLTSIVIYFYDYQKPADHPSFTEALFRPLDTAHYFLSFLGAPLGINNLTLSTSVGLIVLSLWLGLTVYFLPLIIRDFNLFKRLVGWQAIAAYALISGLVTSLGRVGFGISQSLAPRYTAFSIYLIVAVIYLLTIFVTEMKPKKVAKIISYFLVGIVIVLQLNIVNEAIQRMSDRRIILLQSKACLLTVNVIPDNNCLVTKQKLDNFQPTATILNELGFLKPGLLTTNKIGEIAKINNETNYGYFDTYELVEANTYLVRGWAILPERKEPADGVILTYENSQGEGIIFKLINQRFPRQEIAEHLQNAAYLNSGWQTEISAKELPSGTIKLNAWSFDANTGKAYKLNQTHVVINN